MRLADDISSRTNNSIRKWIQWTYCHNLQIFLEQSVIRIGAHKHRWKLWSEEIPKLNLHPKRKRPHQIKSCSIYNLFQQIRDSNEIHYLAFKQYGRRTNLHSSRLSRLVRARCFGMTDKCFRSRWEFNTKIISQKLILFDYFSTLFTICHIRFTLSLSLQICYQIFCQLASFIICIILYPFWVCILI